MDAPARPITSGSGALFEGVPAAVEYVAALLAEAPAILNRAVNKALEDEVEALQGKLSQTQYRQMAPSFDIVGDGADLRYGFDKSGMTDPSGRFVSWRAIEYGEQDLPGTGFLRSAVVNRSYRLGQRITQLISEEL